PETAPSALDKLKSNTHNQMTANILAEAKNTYGSEMKPADKRKLESKINGAADNLIDKSFTNYTIDKNTIEQERTDALQSRHETGCSTAEINQEFDKKIAEATEQFQETLKTGFEELVEESKKDVVKTVETNKREREKSVIEEGIRDHLRGFSRTIPSFLMAYGDNEVTLATFDTVIPDNVFKEVTSITLDQFRFLRDGGAYTDPETGEEKQFEGQLFDPVVFDDSVKEFLALKQKLADYFDEKSVEDIFDYIPPQKTNQIFTPKTIVKKMVDMLEEENPGCFDLPDKTFIDLYMKSGLYIAEIVKRLYKSKVMKRLYPDKYDRLKHIFEKQVYGLAPTEIIYKIATSYILGFDEDVKITKHNFKQVDALPYAKDGTLKAKLDEIYDN
ncbi:MAG: restriction endonuclease, partial [Selenomonadales bacterium]|nr:restriction endonuclease [Selenomonadales bacterium]